MAQLTNAMTVTATAIAAISAQIDEPFATAGHSATPAKTSDVQVTAPAGNASKSAPSTSASVSSAGASSTSPETSSADW